MWGLGWAKKVYHTARGGVMFPETYFIIPVLIKYELADADGKKQTYEVILKEDGTIEGDFDAFDRWCRGTIRTLFAEERVWAWLLREKWKDILDMETVPASPTQTAATVVPVKEPEPVSTEGSDEPVVERPKVQKVILQTVDGPREFEIDIDDNKQGSDNK